MGQESNSGSGPRLRVIETAAGLIGFFTALLLFTWVGGMILYAAAGHGHLPSILALSTLAVAAVYLYASALVLRFSWLTFKDDRQGLVFLREKMAQGFVVLIILPTLLIFLFAAALTGV